jgi:hypothetical protein
MIITIQTFLLASYSFAMLYFLMNFVVNEPDAVVTFIK